MIGEPPSYTCPECHRTSHHPQDVANRYCGACSMFEEHRDPPPLPPLDDMLDQLMKRVLGQMAASTRPGLRLLMDPDAGVGSTDTRLTFTYAGGGRLELTLSIEHFAPGDKED